MTLSRAGRRTIVIAIAMAVLMGTNAGPVNAGAGVTRIQEAIDTHLAAYPGGVQINSRELSYAGGSFVITMAPGPGTRGAADCPRGWFCFYEEPGYGYPRGKLSSCSWQNLAWWGWHNRADSLHFNAATGGASFWDVESGRALRLASVDREYRWRSDLGAKGDRADLVLRTC